MEGSISELLDLDIVLYDKFSVNEYGQQPI